MKKLLALLSVFLFLVAIPMQAQPNESFQPRTGDPTTYMTAEQLTKYHADIRIAELENKLETYGKWVGVGGEIGTAIEEGLTAVVDVADKFGNTDVGRFTIVMIAWKVMGQDVVRIFLGIVFITMFTWLLIYSFKRTCIDRRVLIKKTNEGFMKYPKVKEYKLIEPLFGDGEGLGFIRMAHLLLFMIGIWITYAIMFGGS